MFCFSFFREGKSFSDVLFSVFLSDGVLYSGTAYNFLGSEPIISRYSPTQSLLRTEYSTSWLNGELNELNDCQAVGRIAFKNVF